MQRIFAWLKICNVKQELLAKYYIILYNETCKKQKGGYKCNWENEKSYPDLVTLVKISDEFGCTLDAMLKENPDMTEKMNKNMKYGESSALMGGICSICLFIAAIEMIILQVGSWYWYVVMLLICALNVEAVHITLNQAKSEGKKSMIQLGLFYLAYAVIAFAVLLYTR